MTKPSSDPVSCSHNTCRTEATVSMQMQGYVSMTDSPCNHSSKTSETIATDKIEIMFLLLTRISSGILRAAVPRSHATEHTPGPPCPPLQ